MAQKRDSASSLMASNPVRRVILFCTFVACSTFAGYAQVPLAALQAGQTPHVGANPPAALTITPEGLANLRLAPGNLIAVHVFEEPDLDGSYRIDSHGNVSIPVVGPIQVGGLSLRDAEGAIVSRLVTGEILKNPHVTVNVTDYGSESVVVLGEVNAPGRVTIVGPRRLQEILAMVGGTTIYSGDQIIIERAGQTSDKNTIIHFNRSRGDAPDMDTLIYPGDSIVVKRAGTVYVLGAVLHPGGYVMEEAGTLNVIEAVALASGTTPEAAMAKVRLLRKGQDGTRSFVPVPLNKIQKGEAAATPLQAEDIVYVPPSTLKEVGITIRALLSGAASAAIYLAR